MSLIFDLNLILLVSAGCVVCSSHNETDNPFRLYILHTNDIHSRFEMFNKREVVCKPSNNTNNSVNKKCYGGIARRAGYVKDFRRNHENVLLLDAGDQFQGTPWFYTYKGAASSHFLNKLNYDAMALGNHEFDNGVGGLEPFLNNVTVPILCSNLVKDDNVPAKIKDAVKSHIVLEIGGRKVGIIGYITHLVPTLSKTGNLSFSEEKETIGREVKKLKQKNVDIIIALGHSGLKKDKEMAAELTDVDVIIGGHSHSLLYSGTKGADDKVAGDEVAGEYPEIFLTKQGQVTLVVQAGSFGKYVGMLNLTFDLLGNVIDWSGNPVVMDDRIPEDQDVKQEMEELNVKVNSKFSHVVGRTLLSLDASDNVCRINECNIGNLYSDAMVDFAQEIDRWKNLTIAFTNGGSLRASIDSGNITFGEVLTIWPFSEDIVIVHMDGATLLEVLEHSVSGFDMNERNGKFLQMSGLIVTYDLTAPDGSRVAEVKVRDCYKCCCYKDLNKTQEYDVITQSYLVGGGDGYSMLKKFKQNAVPIDMESTEVLVRYLEHHSPVSPVIEGRIRGLNSSLEWREWKDKNSGCAEQVHAVLLTAFLVALFAWLSLKALTIY